MKVITIANKNLGMIKSCIVSSDLKTVNVTKSGIITQGMKDLLMKFKLIPEIGRFEKIRVDMSRPIQNSSITKASMIVEPSARKGDFRTRVLSFVAYNPGDYKVKRSVAHAVGNNTAIEAVLKDPSTATAFKHFVADSEKFFSVNY